MKDKNHPTIAELTAKILLDIQAITIRPNHPFRYTSGLLSPVYSDLRLLISYPSQRKTVINLLASLVKNIGAPDVIAGTATAGIPHAAWLAEELDVPMVYVRGKPKEHGKQNQIEGLIKKGHKAIVVEDLISTAKSSIETVHALKREGAKANTIVSIFNYTLPQSKQNLKEAKIKLYELTTFPDVVYVAIKEKRMNLKDKETVLEWLKDSSGWGKKMGFE